MANLRDFNASSNSSNLNTDTVEWNVSAFTISSPHDDHAHPTETQLSIMVKCAILIPVVFIGISGNILTLVTIRTTPRLWTKTNVFLASLAVADVLVAATLAYYVAYQLLVYIFINPCYFIRMIAVITPIQTFPLYVSVAHLGLLAADRYVAIDHPFHYERLVTPGVMIGSIATAWAVPSLMSILQMLWLLRVDWNSCDAPYSVTVQFALTVTLYGSVSVVMVAAYTRIFRVVLRQRAKISAIIFVQQTITALAQPSARGPAHTMVTGRGSPCLRAPSKRSEFKAAKMVAVMLASFIVLWFPNVLGKALQAAGRRGALTQYLIDIGIGLGSANNSMSWVIYGTMSQDFRNAVKRLFGSRNMAR